MPHNTELAPQKLALRSSASKKLRTSEAGYSGGFGDGGLGFGLGIGAGDGLGTTLTPGVRAVVSGTLVVVSGVLRLMATCLLLPFLCNIHALKQFKIKIVTTTKVNDFFI